MPWYDGERIPEWKQLIAQPYSFEALLQKKDMLYRELKAEPQLQDWLKKFSKNVVEDGLRYCLYHPQPEDSYERKYTLPTKALEFMTHDAVFSSLGWDVDLVKKYAHDLFANFSSVDPHYNNVNLFQAYLQRLLGIFLQHRVTFKVDIVSALADQQQKHDFLQLLFKHIHKQSAATCLELMLRMDFNHQTALLPLTLKTSIISKAFAIIKSYSSQGSAQLEQKVQNCLILIKNYLFGCTFYVGPKENSNAPSPLCPHKIQHMTTVFQQIKASYYILEGLVIGGGVETCLKIISLEVFMQSDTLIRLGTQTAINLGSFDTQSHSRVIGYLLNTETSLLTPYLLDWLRIVLHQAGETSEQVKMITQTKMASKIVSMLLSSEKNNILASRLSELFMILFDNIDKELTWVINHNRITQPQLIAFPLFNEVFSQLPLLHQKVTSFQKFNDPLFTTFLRIYMVMNNYSRNMLATLSHHSSLQACKQSEQQLMQLVQFYEQTQCFKWFSQNITMRQLGKDQIITPNAEQEPKPTEYSTVDKTIQQKKARGDVVSPVVEFQPVTLPSSFMTAAVMPQQVSQNVKETSTAPQQSSISQKNIQEAIQQGSKGQSSSIIPKTTEKQHSQAENVSSQQVSSNYSEYMRGKLRQVEGSFQERRSKSRTPTKIKGETKKSKNKWSVVKQQPQSSPPKKASAPSESRLRSVSSPDLSLIQSIQIPRLSLMRVPNTKLHPKPTERVLESGKDKALMSLLGALRLIR